jgi:hypothetical protein
MHLLIITNLIVNYKNSCFINKFHQVTILQPKCEPIATDVLIIQIMIIICLPLLDSQFVFKIVGLWLRCGLVMIKKFGYLDGDWNVVATFQ